MRKLTRLLESDLKKPHFLKAWQRLHTPKGMAEFHGDQLYSWMKEHPRKRLTRKECRSMFLMAIESAR